MENPSLQVTLRLNLLMKKNKLNMEICIIDDSHTMRLITSKVCKLILPGTPIQTFASVDEALDYFNEHEAQRRILFVDLEMPEKTGWDFLNVYQPRPEDIVYILSSSDKESQLNKAKEYPFVSDFLIKPLTAQMIRTIAATQL